MTKVEWPTLSAHLPTHRTAPWLVGAIHAAFGALAAVHDADDTAGPLGVVHGDISPTNVAVSPDAASALILDFGLAFGGRWPRRADGAFRGTVAYAAPEAARGEALDARADLFAMAATLLHIASGEPPRGAVTLAAAIAEAAEAPLAPWASRASSRLPAEVGALLERCVAHDPDDRPASARAVLATLVRLVPPVT
jgi:serine/threonine protein kinase